MWPTGSWHLWLVICDGLCYSGVFFIFFLSLLWSHHFYQPDSVIHLNFYLLLLIYDVCRVWLVQGQISEVGFYSTVMQVLGIELGSTNLSYRYFTCWVITPALVLHFCMPMSKHMSLLAGLWHPSLRRSSHSLDHSSYLFSSQTLLCAECPPIHCDPSSMMIEQPQPRLLKQWDRAAGLPEPERFL